MIVSRQPVPPNERGPAKRRRLLAEARYGKRGTYCLLQISALFAYSWRGESRSGPHPLVARRAMLRAFGVPSADRCGTFCSAPQAFCRGAARLARRDFTRGFCRFAFCFTPIARIAAT